MFAFTPKDLGDSFQAIFVGVDPDDITRGLVARVTKGLFVLQTTSLRKYNIVVQSCHYDAEQGAKRQATEVIDGIVNCFQTQPEPGDRGELVGVSKVRGIADATTEAFDNGEAAVNLPFVSFPDTEMQGFSGPSAVALVTAKTQSIMIEQALRIQGNETRSGVQGCCCCIVPLFPAIAMITAI